MANGLTHLPHVTNVQAGNNLWDPVHGAVYEVYFTLPTSLQSEFQEDCVILTEQVTDVQGLDALQRTTGAGSQKFLGVDASFLNPMVDNTYADITINFNLNLRNVTDNYVLKLFKAWEKLGYNLEDGTRTIMKDYTADNMQIAEANRDGTIWRSYVFHKILVTSVTGLDGLNYNDNEARKLTVVFRADWWIKLHLLLVNM
jgi:hypothetical protein